MWGRPWLLLWKPHVTYWFAEGVSPPYLLFLKTALTVAFHCQRRNFSFYSFFSLAKLDISFLVPTPSKAISSRTSLPIGDAARIIPFPNAL